MNRKFACLLTLACMATSVHAAGLSVSSFGMLTNGRLNGAGAYVLSTRIDIDILIEGGAKFDAWFKLGFRAGSVEDYLAAVGAPTALQPDAALGDVAAAVAELEAASGLSLRIAAIQVKQLLGTPLELATFVGHLDTFCSGEDFPRLFGTDDFATKFRGYMYYPNGIGGDLSRLYDGLHSVYGTGFRLSLPGESFMPFLYAYQDSWLGAGRYSADARVLFNGETVKLEAFAGATFPESAAGVYRGGLLFYYDTAVIGDFYAQIGIPRWDPTAAFGMDMLYFMFEPRVKFGEGTLVLSLFFHPKWYLQQETSESGAAEMRFDIGFGQLNEGKVRGGAELELAFNPNLSESALVIDAAPYIQMIKNGVRWDMRLALRAFPFPAVWYGMFMPSIGVATSF